MSECTSNLDLDLGLGDDLMSPSVIPRQYSTINAGAGWAIAYNGHLVR